MPITAAQLYDHNTCPHRVQRDLFDDTSTRDKINSFIQLLWDKGTKYEQKVIRAMSQDFTDLHGPSPEERERLTLEAMQRGDVLIYGGCISHGDLLGQPDLLRRTPNGYIAGDIKSGAGLEGDEDKGKLKAHYALQLALYTDILEKLGLSAGRYAFVWDIKGQEVIYALTDSRNSRAQETWWDLYLMALQEVRGISAQTLETEPAYSANCKLCHWYSTCKDTLTENDDLTLLPDLGAGRKQMMRAHFGTTSELADAHLDHYVQGKKSIISGIGLDSLIKFQKRAKLRQSNGQPYFEAALSFPVSETEIFYDIEVDPMRDLCYLHGFTERKADGTESFTGFMLDEPTPAEEKRIFAQTIDYLKQRQNWTMYYYSPYERTWWRKLQARYPHLLTAYDVDALYRTENNKAIDLYHGAATKIIWPTIDHSVKTLARYFGFNWRDLHPSGAASVEWFDTWVTSRSPLDRQRILDYNEDDCIAMRVVLDGIRQL